MDSLLCPDDGPDILLHVNVLRNFGQSSVADGAGIDVVTHRTDRGVQAVEIVSITPPEREDTPVLSDLAQLDDEELSNTPLEPARVKWFDKAKGFGFANVFGRDEDVFLHVEVLRQSGLSDVQSGRGTGDARDRRQTWPDGCGCACLGGSLFRHQQRLMIRRAASHRRSGRLLGRS